MSTAGAVALLRRHGLRVLTTGDFRVLTGLAPAAATQTLRRLAAAGLLSRIKKGVWVSALGAAVDAYEAVAYLRAPWPAYVSLYSALADYGVVAEVPQVVYAVSPALPKRYRTTLGEFHFHHLPARLIWGFEERRTAQGSYPFAEREKAFLDLVYLALTPRSPLTLPVKRGRKWDLDGPKLRAYARRFEYAPLARWLAAQGLA